MRSLLTYLNTLWVILLLSSCGGGNSDRESERINLNPTFEKAIEGGGFRAIEGGGIISDVGPDFSSITIAESEYDTSDSNLVVTIDDELGSVYQLEVGDVVRFTALGKPKNPVALATSIEVLPELSGPITPNSINYQEGSFTVLGQTIQISAGTVFDDEIWPTSLEGLADNDFVEVSGLLGAAGLIIAGRVEMDSDGDEFELFGVVNELNAKLMEFKLGQQRVDYSSADLDGFPNGVPENGDSIELEATEIDTNGTLIAEDIEKTSTEFSGEEGDEVELEGLITRFNSITDFDVSGFTITTDEETEFDDGSSGDLQLNALIEVEGELNAEGVLVAEEIKFIDEGNEIVNISDIF